MKLSKNQSDLLAYMAAGGVVYYVGGMDAHYFCVGPPRSVTTTVRALEKRGLARTVGKWGSERLLLTTEGIEAAKALPSVPSVREVA